MYLDIATNPARLARQRIEGPTARQAIKMAARREQWLLTAKQYLDQDPTDADFRAFRADCEAFDIEGDLVTYGFDPITGKRNRSAR